MPLTANLRGILFAILAFAFLSCADALIKSLGSAYTVYQILFFSTVFALIPITVFILFDAEATNFRPRHPWLLAIRTAIMIGAFFCVYTAFTTLPLAQAYAILFSAPLLITALSVPILKEAVGLPRWIAVCVGLIGVVVVLRPGVSPLSAGHIAAMCAAVLFAFSSLIVRRIGSAERSATMLLLPYLGLIVVMGVLMRADYQPIPVNDMTTLMLIGCCSVGGQLFTIFAYRSAPAALVAPMQYTQIIWAVAFGYLFFDEFPDIWVALGTTIIIASGLFVVLRESRSKA